MPKKIDPALYVTIGTAAKLADVSRYWMRQRVQDGTISGVEIDGQWFALRSAAEGYRRSACGRPRAAKAVNPAK